MRWLSSRVVEVFFKPIAVDPTFGTVEKEVWIWISYRFWVALLQVLMVFSHRTQVAGNSLSRSLHQDRTALGCSAWPTEF